MLDRVSGMQVFQRVAALGSLSAAARDLHMSQTMATKHMAALEGRLGTKLLHRTTRRLTLTEAGRTYLAACERILEDIADADEQASTAAAQVRGTLRLNVPVSFGIREIAPRLGAFAALHPALAIDLGLSDRHVDLLEEGWDLAIRIGTLKDSSMQARRLAPCRMMVCAAPTYLAAHGTPRRIADLKQHNCLRYTLSRATTASRWVFGDGRVSVPVHGTLQASNGDTLVAAAVAGLGIVYQPTFILADALRAGDLVPLALDHAPIQLGGIFAVYPAERAPPAKIRAVIDYFAMAFAPEPPWERGLAEPRRNARATAGRRKAARGNA